MVQPMVVIADLAIVRCAMMINRAVQGGFHKNTGGRERHVARRASRLRMCRAVFARREMRTYGACVQPTNRVLRQNRKTPGCAVARHV